MPEQYQPPDNERITHLEERVAQVSAELSSVRDIIDEIGQLSEGRAATVPIAAPPPVSLETLVHVMWIHGTSLHVFDPRSSEDFRIQRDREGTRIFYTNSISHTVSFAIPTPAVVSERNLSLRSVIVRFSSSRVSITEAHIHDGSDELVSHVGFRISGTDFTQTFPVPRRPRVSSGIGVTLRISVDDEQDVTGTAMIVHAVGAEFVFRPGLRL